MVSVPARWTQVAFATGARPIAAAGLHAAQCRALGVALPVAASGEGCAGAGADGRVGGAVSALWLPAHLHLSRPPPQQFLMYLVQVARGGVGHAGDQLHL